MRHSVKVDDRDILLIRKSRTGSLRVIQNLIDSGADPNCEYAGSSPIHEACAGGNLDVLMRLLSYGADVNKVDKSGKRPLHHAVLSGHLKVSQQLIDHGASVNAQDNYGNTVLHQASRAGSEAIVRVLKSNHADPDIRNHAGETFLHTAARLGHCRVIQIALEDSDGNGNARWRGVLDSQNLMGQTPLMHACSRPHHAKNCVKLLIELGANMDIKDNEGRLAKLDEQEYLIGRSSSLISEVSSGKVHESVSMDVVDSEISRKTSRFKRTQSTQKSVRSLKSFTPFRAPFSSKSDVLY
eukprot:CAMPEP_0182444458 /NCGR_PEP_ID=MMETSP1172-20130603/2907_1 /TAXON_ID=708627 /ORGANISM="Timspurckia oligopyrenoides, Strain CCMP3278" /LENGTH=296 /DNA_ID=CAMNT_0024640015 /DNA_START=391 /DNA_END=1281 /DNA_ORIENTATION=+